jgi:Ni/Co efflux regulator RcnB
MHRLTAVFLAIVALAAPGAALAHADPSHRVPRRVVQAAGAPSHWDQRNKTWWHGRPGWRGYRGRLRGFWFVPGFGYYPAPPRDHKWRRGEYLADPWRHNYVRDWPWFGLKVPPRGYAWVWCGDQFALVSQGSGLILDVVSDVY